MISLLSSKWFLKIVKSIPMIILLLLCASVLYADNYVVSSSIEISETAINKFLEQQFNLDSFQKNISGTMLGIGTYSVTITQPQLVLDTNTARIQFLTNVTTEIGSWQYLIDTPITISPVSISLSQIQGFLQNVPNIVDTWAVPTEIKPTIKSYLQGLNLQLYPKNLLASANSVIFDKTPLRLTDIGLSLSIQKGYLQITPSVNINSNGDIFYLYIDWPNNKAKIRAFLPCTLVWVKIYDQQAFLAVSYTRETIVPKLVDTEFSCNGLDNLSHGFYLAYALIRTENTFYIRKFKVTNFQTQWNIPLEGIN